ncbi:MAG: potassium channel protein [Actinobacteria bacterium]|nr:potassium channel protein [Actinomycetota bacterium]
MAMSRAPAHPRAGTGASLSPQLRRLRIALSFFFGALALGVLGYRLLLGLGWIDALYMTVITVSTVGFREVVSLTPAAEIFTVVLIVAGVGSASYSAFSAVEVVVEGHLRHELERRRMNRKIGRLQGHVIVCGYGRVGRHVALSLGEERGTPFVVVDSDERHTDLVRDDGCLFVLGDATAEHVLEEAGLPRARALVSCVNSDADNVLIVLTSKGLRPDLTVVARAKTDENEAKLRRAGADRVISPTTIGGRRIAQILTRPVVADFLDGLGAGGIEYTLDEVPVREGSELAGATLEGAGLRERHRCTVLAVHHAEGGWLDTHPEPDSRLHAGDVLVVMGGDDDVHAMRERFVGR